MDWSFSDNGLLQRHPVLAFARMKPEGPGLGFLVVRSVAVFGLRKYVWCLDMSAFLYLIVRMHRQASGQAYECMLRESLHINNQPTKTSVIMSACKHILESCTVCIYEYRHTHTHTSRHRHALPKVQHQTAGFRTEFAVPSKASASASFSFVTVHGVTL